MRIALFLTVLWMLGGCATQQEVFVGHDADQVWTAMLAVARTPDYMSGEPADRWIVRENQVWVDDEANRIEIFRRLERIRKQPASKPLHQERAWKFQIVLEDVEPPTVKFRSRNWGVPSHAWDEAERYFNEVWDILGGRPAAQPSRTEDANAALAIPREQPPPPQDPAAPIDVDELE